VGGDVVPQVRRTYDFKSVGQLQQTYDENISDLAKTNPIGIRTPVSFAMTGNDMFSMSYDMPTQIMDNLRNLLSTNSGERLLMTDMGANLRPLAMEMTAEDADAEAARRIATAVEKFMPYIELDSFEPSVEKSDNDNVIQSQIRITYSVPALGLNNQAVEVIIFTAG
jgi:phage baseplate assembly protein W